jgi:hypothetical protein
VTGVQPPAVPVFYPGVDVTSQFNTGNSGNGGIRDTFTFLNNKPKFRARRVAAQTIATGHQYITWDTIDFDTYSGWGPSQTPAQPANTYIVQAPGWYLITARVTLGGTGAAGLNVISSVAVNGASPTGIGSPGWEGVQTFVPTGASTQPKSSNSCWEVYASLGATIQIDLWYSSESTITATDTTAGFQPEISLVWTGK